MTETGKKDFKNPDNTVYTSYYAKVVTSDGIMNEYETANDYSSFVCSAVRISFKNGKATLKRVNDNGGVYGKVNAKAGTIGDYDLADDVKILDTAGTEKDDIPAYKKIYPQRLDKITIDPANVLYSSKNNNGEIDELILKNVTGDMYTYGVVIKSEKNTNVTVSQTGETDVVTDANGNIVYEPGIVEDANGNLTVGVVPKQTNKTVTSANTTNTLTIEVDNNTYSYGANVLGGVGPCRIKASGGYVDDFMQLHSYPNSISSLTRTEAVIRQQTYKLSDKVEVYQKIVPATYMKITLDDAINGNYRLTAYYDKAESSGGRIRIIIAERR